MASPLVGLELSPVLEREMRAISCNKYYLRYACYIIYRLKSLRLAVSEPLPQGSSRQTKIGVVEPPSGVRANFARRFDAVLFKRKVPDSLEADLDADQVFLIHFGAVAADDPLDRAKKGPI